MKQFVCLIMNIKILNIVSSFSIGKHEKTLLFFKSHQAPALLMVHCPSVRTPSFPTIVLMIKTFHSNSFLRGRKYGMWHRCSINRGTMTQSFLFLKCLWVSYQNMHNCINLCWVNPQSREHNTLYGYITELHRCSSRHSLSSKSRSDKQWIHPVLITLMIRTRGDIVLTLLKCWCQDMWLMLLSHRILSR